MKPRSSPRPIQRLLPGRTNQPATATATVTVKQPGNINSVNHVIFLLQENRTFDTYFGMLNPYRQSKGWNIGDDGKEYDVDGIDDKLTTFTNQDDEGDSFGLFKFASSCIDDMSSAWLESYGDVNRFDFSLYAQDANGRLCPHGRELCQGHDRR